jgi:hypothetical protein
VFEVRHASGTTVRIAADGAVEVDAGRQGLTLRGGGVTVTLDQGKVAIS